MPNESCQQDFNLPTTERKRFKIMQEIQSPPYYEYKGIRMPLRFSPVSIASAIDYKHKPGELYVVCYPKSGSTWLQHIIMLILRKGQPIRDELDFLLNSPLLEVAGPEALNIMNKPGVIKTHLPFKFLHISPEAKYIYIARNPKDCCVSFYCHLKKVYHSFRFDQFFEQFISDKTLYCDYFDHILPWYSHKDDANVHFIRYEDLKKDTNVQILKLAKFIGEDYYNSLINDTKYMENVLYYSSFEYMKEKVKYDTASLMMATSNLTSNITLSFGLKYLLDFQSHFAPPKDTFGIRFVRKGIVGDWKNHFTAEQEERMQNWIKQKTAGSDVMTMWNDLTN